jgi:hypothetical protein
VIAQPRVHLSQIAEDSGKLRMLIAEFALLDS